MDAVTHPSVRTAAEAARRALLERLIRDGLISTSALNRAEVIAERTGQPVEQVLNQIGVLDDDALRDGYAAIAGCGIWVPSLDAPTIDLDALGVSRQFLLQRRLLPLRIEDEVLICAACDPLDNEGLTGLAFATGKNLTILAAGPSDWRRAFDELTPPETTAPETDERRLDRDLDHVGDQNIDGVGARFLSSVMERALALGASDLHIEPRRHDLRVRLRLDGRLLDHQIASPDLAAPALARIKVIAGLDLGEKRLPQDGRTTAVIQGRSVDVRVSIMPTAFGESAVLRILDRHSAPMDLPGLGFVERDRSLLHQAVRSSHGMFLMSGPTGSGKTTTLYALLQTLADRPVKILSVEDPIEYHFEHVSQTQVAPQIGLTFAHALRAFLRQDPDVIMVGEIRDPETAAVAVQAAMTGHLVLASVHANSALGVVSRLADMGIEPFQLAASLNGAAAQRLVRKLCPKCRKPEQPTVAERQLYEAHGEPVPKRLFRAVGCDACHGLGYRGRMAVAEIFIASDALLHAISRQMPAESLAQQAALEGYVGMAVDGLRKAARGELTVEEVMATVSG
jgi:general secretion pathway protein E